jgi:hypothetical protein
MAQKYGALYVTKQVLKGLTCFGVAQIFGSVTENYCREAGYGRLATTTAKVAAWNVGGMISWKTCEFIDDTATKLEKALVKRAEEVK